MVMKFFKACKAAASTTLTFLTRSTASTSLSQAVKNHALSASSFAMIAVGAFEANTVAGFITLGILGLIFNERIAT